MNIKSLASHYENFISIWKETGSRIQSSRTEIHANFFSTLLILLH